MRALYDRATKSHTYSTNCPFLESAYIMVKLARAPEHVISHPGDEADLPSLILEILIRRVGEIGGNQWWQMRLGILERWCIGLPSLHLIRERETNNGREPWHGN